jgi:hypothetical protein
MFLGYLKLTNVQNVHHQPQCIAYNNVQQGSGIAGGIATEAISILCLRSCSVLGFLVHTVFFKSLER